MDSNILIAFFGLIISGLVYFKDRPLIVVSLDLNVRQHGQRFVKGGKIGSDNTHFVVRVYNAGRRPVYLDSLQIVTSSSVNPIKDKDGGPDAFTLTEGCGPITRGGHQEWLEQHKEKWWEIRAAISDVKGNFYYSEYLTEAPVWAENISPPQRVIRMNMIKNYIRRHVLRYL